jgi:hypothetical protein
MFVYLVFSADSVPPATNVGGFDLLAWNINRGRDHGIPRKPFQIIRFYLSIKSFQIIRFFRLSLL